MSPMHVRQVVPLLLAFVCAGASTAIAQDAQSHFERGFFLQTHEKDLQGAIEAFEKVAADEGAPAELRNEAKQRAAACREDLRSADFARLMPPGSIAYAEFVDPGEHVENLVRMLGLLAAPGSAGTADTSATPNVTPLGDGLYFPDNFTVSPALVDEFKEIKGAAVALTSLSSRGEPDGVAVIHPGDSGLIRGLLETAVQLLQPAEPIEGFRAYRFEQPDLTLQICVTERLLFVTRSREELVAAVRRLNDPEAESLASQDSFQRVQEQRKGALLFAYADGKLAQRALAEVNDREAQMARAFLDLKHLHSVSAVLRTTEDAIELQARLDLAEGHRNLLYSLLRTAPMTRRSLEHVPSGAAAVAIIGLNRPGDVPAVAETPEQKQYVALMDIGREIFGNIEEVGLFVMPTASGGPIPDVGVIIAVKDAERSELLWNQLMSLPAMFDPEHVAGPKDIEIEGRSGREYRFPELPPIALVRLDRALVAGTRPAVEAVVKTGNGVEPITQDAGFRSLLDGLTPESSKAVLIHAGRTLQAFAPLAGRRDAAELQQIAGLLENLKILIATDEAPTQFTLRAKATGLPHVPTIVKALSGRPAHSVSRNGE